MPYIDQEPVLHEAYGNVNIYRVDNKPEGQCVSCSPPCKWRVCLGLTEFIIKGSSGHSGLEWARKTVKMIQEVKND